MSKSKVLLSASDITKKWGETMKASAPYIVKAVDAVTENPMEEAAKAVESGKYLAKVTAAVPKMIGALRKVTLNDWKTVTKSKVQARLASGVDAAMVKRGQFDQWLIGRLNGILPQIKAAPSMTLEDGVTRVRMLMEHMASQPYKTS